ncbi:MAG: hypothetical protein IJL54_11555 [Prevotella sp.]|nr:hypothetical protein [Prevotella sp.]
MKKLLKYLGLPLVFVGLLWLVICFLAGWTNSNALLITGVILIAVGIITYVMKMKNESNY